MEKELKKYLIEQCRKWMLPEELKALRRSTLTEFGQESTNKIASRNIKMELIYGFNDDKTNELVSLGKDELENQIAIRLLKDHEQELINNCPSCGALARTPFAKQCRFCRHDWH